MFAKHETMIGIDNKHGVFPQIVAVHGIENLAELAVAHGDHCGIKSAEMLDIWLLAFFNATIWWPVQGQPQGVKIIAAIKIAIFLLTEKRFVRIKGLDSQESIILIVVFADEFKTAFKGFRLGHFLFGVEPLSVDIVGERVRPAL